MEQPPWLAAAWAEFGVAEGEGQADNPTVVAYFREVGQPAIVHDEVAWCAAFAGAMLGRAGEAHTGSLLARSYLAWGQPLADAKLGAIAVLERGDDPGAGHVGFVVGASEERLFLLGGNQGDRVSVTAFDVKHLLGFRWPAPSQGREETASEALFERCLAHVLNMEGGFTDDPYDPGGPTNLGITLDDLARWKGVTVDAASRAGLLAELRAISADTVRAIYLARYWGPAGCASLPPAVAFMQFDAAVNHGVVTAIRMLQEAAGANIDGEIGPKTIAAVQQSPVGTLVARYGDLRRARYRALSLFWRFGRGWLARVDATVAGANAEIKGSGAPSAEPQPSIPLNGNTGEANMGDEIETQDTAKWWARSRPIWGAAITAIAAIAPVLGPLIGIDLSGDVVRAFGDQAVLALQALGGLVGTVLTIYGRLNATTLLVRRDLNVKI